jgi:hypothetical protein
MSYGGRQIVDPLITDKNDSALYVHSVKYDSDYTKLPGIVKDKWGKY